MAASLPVRVSLTVSKDRAFSKCRERRYRRVRARSPARVTHLNGYMLAEGAGLGALPLFVATPYLQTGELARLDVDLGTSPASLLLVWLSSRHLAPRVRAFIDLAAEHARATDWSMVS
jgi:DNA-binding transcriptional LysR family regulator